MEIVRISNRAEDLVHGQTDLGLEAVPLTGPFGRRLYRSIFIQGDKYNKKCYVGGPTVSHTNGYLLESCDTLEIFADDPSKIFVIACDVGGKVYWYAI